ncbi:ABC-type spermidine/putrescine transport system permease subunit II [Bradyrhizobium japonicum]
MALFAFVTSFDEAVIALFVSSAERRTSPKFLFSGIREEVGPTIITATVLLLFSTAMLTTVELLRRRSQRLRGSRST